jgi:hypothetical protein
MSGVLLATTLGCALLPTSVSATSADSAATHTYREAGSEYAQAFIANAPRSKLAVKALSARLASECPGVLSGAIEPIALHVRRILGLKPETLLGARADSTLVGQGKTAAGGHYAVRVEPHSTRNGCPLSVGIEHTTPLHGPHRGSSGSGVTRCLSRRDSAPAATVTCQPGQGLIEIESHTLADTRRVRLELSNGRTITSTAVIIPARLGGPAGLYFQVLRGPSPYPVSLTELNGRGRTLRTVRLRPVRDCKAQPPSRSGGPTFVNLAQGTTPTGATFAVMGVIAEFGKHERSFSLTVPPTGPGTGSEGSGSISAQARYEGAGGQAPVFPWSLSLACPPDEYAILYGLLVKPGVTVLARTGSTVTPLQVVAIPPSLHAGGSLAYGAFSAIPSELVVSAADGSTLLSESLASKIREHAEYCEGYAEP